jgi:hypothetical protein
LAGETEVLGENLSQRHFCPSQNPTWPDPGLNPGRRGGNHLLLSLGAVFRDVIIHHNCRRCVDDTKIVVADVPS